MTTLGLKPGTTYHKVNRDSIFQSVITLYTENSDILQEYPFGVHFSGERALDIGGVTRDMFSAFFQESYKHLFDGVSLLIPALHPSVDMAAFRTMGTVISHAYLTSGILPIRVAFPCLASMLLGTSSEIPQSQLVAAFTEMLSVHDASVVRNALEMRMQQDSFPPDMVDELLQVLSSYSCREIPRPSTLRSVIQRVARYELVTKPTAALSAIHSGVPKMHEPFWSRMSIQQFHMIYRSLSVSTGRVLSLIEEPLLSTPAQEQVWSFLRRFVGNLTQSELCTFLRFITGSFVAGAGSIIITFNRLDGLARRPISHTCSCTLELPVTYSTFMEFDSEFRCVLSNPDYSWRMDAV